MCDPEKCYETFHWKVSFILSRGRLVLSERKMFQVSAWNFSEMETGVEPELSDPNFRESFLRSFIRVYVMCRYIWNFRWFNVPIDHKTNS